MSKRKNKSADVRKNTLFVLVVLTIITIVMAFLANVKYPVIIGDDVTVSGLNVIFGWKEETFGNNTIQISSFSILALLAYALPIIGVVLFVTFKKSKLLCVAPLLCFVASAVLLFLMPDLVVFGDQAINAYVGGELAFGAIIAAISSILSALAVIASILLS